MTNGGSVATRPTGALWRWFDRTILDLGREMRLSYLPPLMVYVAAGISGLTGIVGVFFVKDYLGLSAAFLAALSFWVGIPWVLKMPLGHLVDLIWRHKAGLVYLGASLIAASLLIMAALIGERSAMAAIMPVEAWYVLSALLAPVGYVLQDVVADAMTVEAVPRVDAAGRPIDPADRKQMNTTVQTLGRVAIIGGSVLVALINVALFRGVDALSEAEKVAIYRDVYLWALVIPLISVAGVVLASVLSRRHLRSLRDKGFSHTEARTMVDGNRELTTPNWGILGGGAVFVVFTLGLGLLEIPFDQEIIFAGSMAIVLFLMGRLLQSLEPAARRTLIGTAAVIFAFRAAPLPGPGVTWWMIDELGFDQQFLSVLSVFGSGLTLAALFLCRRFVADRPIDQVILALAIAGALLGLPLLGMFYGLHHWTAAVTGGVVDARFIAVIDTALESPLMQIAMIPMLAWIANSAPTALKATYFAVMASFSNLALSLGQLGTKYLNEIFVVTREVRDPSGIVVSADYHQLGWLMLTSGAISLALPLAAVFIARRMRLGVA